MVSFKYKVTMTAGSKAGCFTYVRTGAVLDEYVRDADQFGCGLADIKIELVAAAVLEAGHG